MKHFCYIFFHVDKISISLRSNNAHSYGDACSKHQLPARRFLTYIVLIFFFSLVQLLIVLAMVPDLESRLLEFLRLYLTRTPFYQPVFPSHIEIGITPAAVKARLFTHLIVKYVEHSSKNLLTLRGVSQGFIILKQDGSKKQNIVIIIFTVNATATPIRKQSCCRNLALVRK